MQREEAIQGALELRAKGLKLREIAAELGIGLSTAGEYVTDPTGRAKSDRMRKAGATACADCGGPTAGFYHRVERCAECARALQRRIVRERTIRWLELRNAGLNNKQIAEREGVSRQAVANALCRAKRRFPDLDVPRSPYPKRKAA